MKILLANMPINFNSRENLEPPLGICYIAAMLKKVKGAEVYLKDYEVYEFTEESLKKDINEMGIDAVGISFRTASYRSAKEYINALRRAKPGVFIFAGGHHATAFPKETILDLGCDAIVRGEGEYAVKELIEKLMAGKDASGVNGVSYKGSNGQIVINPPAFPIENIEELPWPARELLDLSQYNVITLLTSRGCPFGCIYCDKGISTRNVKFRSSEDIFKEIKYLVNELGKKKLYVVDDHFFLNKKVLVPVLDDIIREKVKFNWTCQARVDGISEDIMKKAKAAGCEQVMFGIETGDEAEHKYIKKGSSIKQAETAVSITKKAGVKARTNFMMGFPVSTRGSLLNTIRFAAKIQPDIVRFFAVSPLPNTELWDNIYGKNYIPPDIRWDELDFYKPSFDLKDMTRDELSLYVSAAYWHVLKKKFLAELLIFGIPNALKLLFYTVSTGKIRGNISKCFPRTVNLLVDNMHQIKGKSIRQVLEFAGKVYRLERTF